MWPHQKFLFCDANMVLKTGEQLNNNKKKTLVISAESDAEDLKLATVAPVARLEGLSPHQMDSGIFYKKRDVGSLSFLLKGQKER